MTVLVLVTLLALGSLALTAQPAAAQEQQENATLPISYPPTVLESDSESCASIEEREMARTQICEDIRGILRDVIIPSIQCGGPGGGGFHSDPLSNMQNSLVRHVSGESPCCVCVCVVGTCSY